MTRNQAVRRDDMVGGRNDDRGRQGRQDEWTDDGYELRPGHHYGAPQEPDGEQDYDPRAYAPNPEEPYGYADDGSPIYYEPEPSRLKAGRSGVLMVGAVLAVALVGGAGAIGYKMMSPAGLSGEPPLIRAETEPFKTLPKATAEDQQTQNKAVYDRVDPNAGPKSKVVSREEEPVDLPTAPTGEQRGGDASRIILPGGPASAEPTPPDTSGSEPRRVKTVAIRPNGPMAPQSAQVRPAGDPAGDSARSGEAPRGSEFDNGIMAGDEPRLRSGEPGLAAVPPKPASAPRPQSAQAPVATPRASAAQPASQPVQQPRVTTVPASRVDPAQVAAVTPRAPAPAATAQPSAGGFVVQVTSQRSEADARSAYSNLQKRFPQVLGPYKASLQTATVADRGTFYRVRVGPFANGGDAATVCNNLRSAGGECVVAKN